MISPESSPTLSQRAYVLNGRRFRTRREPTVVPKGPLS